MKKFNFAALAVIAIALAPLDAFAYLDPGTGSALLQGILGALAAVVVVLKLYWHRLLRLFGLRKNTAAKTEKETDASSGNGTADK